MSSFMESTRGSHTNFIRSRGACAYENICCIHRVGTGDFVLCYITL